MKCGFVWLVFMGDVFCKVCDGSGCRYGWWFVMDVVFFVLLLGCYW